MNNGLYNRILSLLPSSCLKETIQHTDFRLSDRDLLTIAWRYAPDYETRLGMLRELGECFTGNLKEYVFRLIEVQRQALDSFLNREEDCVYELHMKETPDSYDERSLCRSYEEALRLIPLIYQEYPFCKEREETRYRVIKRRVLSDKTGFVEDEIGQAQLLPGLKLYEVEMYDLDYRAEGCTGGCLSCERPCVQSHDVLFPPFIRHGEAVEYQRDPYLGEKSFGIFFDVQQDEAPCADYYVIPLESLAVRYHDFKDIHNAHQHVPAPLVARIEPSALPEKLLTDYEACLEYILENWPGNKRP